MSPRFLQKMSEEQADSACTKALAVQGPLTQLHDSKKLNLEQYVSVLSLPFTLLSS